MMDVASWKYYQVSVFEYRQLHLYGIFARCQPDPPHLQPDAPAPRGYVWTSLRSSTGLLQDLLSKGMKKEYRSFLKAWIVQSGILLMDYHCFAIAWGMLCAYSANPVLSRPSEVLLPSDPREAQALKPWSGSERQTRRPWIEILWVGENPLSRLKPYGLPALHIRRRDA